VAIDACPYNFKELSEEVLPKDMERMRAALAAPLQMNLVLNRGRREVLRHFDRTSDFSGCYVLVEKDEPSTSASAARSPIGSAST
jgi:hypothetical protein